MSTITTKDGATIFYKDWGKGKPVVFSHGWPLCSDAWDEQLVFFASRGYRAIAHDRRGHGRSSQTWDGNDMDTYADDLAALLEKLELRDAMLVGHSTGGGEVTRYVGRHGNARLSRLVLLSAVAPLMLKTEANPLGTPLAVFDQIRAGVAANRSQYYRDLSESFYGFNRPQPKALPGIRDQFWLQGMQVGLKGALECIKAFSETDLTEDLKRVQAPTLVIHGDDDQIVPIDASARRAVKFLKHGRLKVYSGGSHGLSSTHTDELNADLLEFAQS